MRLFASRSFASAVLLFLAPACGRPTWPASPAHPLIGHPLPAIHRRALDGQALDTAQLAGKPMVVKFFADYCRPCKDTLPAAERVHKAHSGVLFVGIDEDESAETAGSLVQRYSLTFPVIHDDGNLLSGRFRVANMPATFVADAAGIIRWVGDEKQSEEDIRRAVEAAGD